MTPKLTIDEVGARGGRSKSAKKLAASRQNIAKAKAVLAKKRLAKKQSAA